MILRRVIGGGLLIAGSLTLADRIGEGSVIEGPERYSEVPHMSVNRYVDGEKQDDRTGDLGLGLAALGLLCLVFPDLRSLRVN